MSPELIARLAKISNIVGIKEAAGGRRPQRQPVMEPVKSPKTLIQATGKAIGDFDMIRDGDRVLLGLSGGTC